MHEVIINLRQPCCCVEYTCMLALHSIVSDGITGSWVSKGV